MTNAPPPPPAPEQTYKLWALSTAHLFASDAVTPEAMMKRLQTTFDEAADAWREQYETAKQGMGLKRAGAADRLAWYEQRLVRTGPTGQTMMIGKTIELWAMQKAQLPWEFEEDAQDAVELGARGLPPFVLQAGLEAIARTLAADTRARQVRQ